MTLEEALSPSVPGWNMRCNLCGEHPANWIANQRPGWGSLALCPTHEAELRAELARHNQALQRLRKINFEQLLQSEVHERVKRFRKSQKLRKMLTVKT